MHHRTFPVKRIARGFAALALVAFLSLLAGSLHAQSDYYRHVVFDNSLTKDTYYFSRGESNGQSFIEQRDGRLPVETSEFRTPPNALRIQWQSALAGGWIAQISMLNFRNRVPGVIGRNLYFWIYAPQPISAAEMPRLVLSTSSEGLQVAEFPASFSAPIDIGKYTGDVAAGRWIEVRIPLAQVASASIYPFHPEHLNSLTFHQGHADNVRHTLILDEIRVGDDPRPQPTLSAPHALRATGYDRHVELEWEFKETAGLARYVIYRALDGGQFIPIGIQLPGIQRYEDFLGKSRLHARYRISAADWSYHESPPSNQAEASTQELSDDDLLTMMQHACFHYYWEGADSYSGMTLENIPGDDRIVATGASGFGIMTLIVGVDRHFITREEGVARLTKIVKFLEQAQRYHGAWSHYMNGSTGQTMPVFGMLDNGGDLVETSFLMQGLLSARQYFHSSSPAEQELYRHITELWNSVEWDWYRQTSQSDFLFWHWSPQWDFQIHHPLIGFNETMITYLLAIASPTHGVPASMYYSGWASQSELAQHYRQGWSGSTDGNHYANGNTYFGIKLDVGVGRGGPLFFTHYFSWALIHTAFTIASPNLTSRTIATLRASTAPILLRIQRSFQDMERMPGGSPPAMVLTAM